MAIQTELKGISRREFLYYMWGAGAGLLGVGACGAATWFALPNSGVAEGYFTIDSTILPVPNVAPKGFPEGRLWLSMTDKGLLALSMYCPKDFMSFKWVPTNDRFECPGCGSKFRLDGNYISGPSIRNLDRYRIYLLTQHGILRRSDNGEPVNVEGATKIVIDTSHKILGSLRN